MSLKGAATWPSFPSDHGVLSVLGYPPFRGIKHPGERKACKSKPAFSIHAYAHAFSPGILFFFIGSSAFLRGECAPVSLFSLILPANRT